MEIRLANVDDYLALLMVDHHINKDELALSISLKRIYVAYENEEFVGWLRYNLFWDQIPFINMLYVMEDFRGQGYGIGLMNSFEKEMKKKYSKVMVSTQANEYAQHFYDKIGYKAIGGFMLPKEEYEVLMVKTLKRK
jgi:ribosomal protein S18 acetylase RimI-like enzyme